MKTGIDLYARKYEIIPKLVGAVSPVKVDREYRTCVPCLWAIGDTSVGGAGMTGL
jgi:aspartate oxidase